MHVIEATVDDIYAFMRSAGTNGWALYTIMALEADEDGKCGLTLEAMAERLGVSRRTVQTYLTKLNVVSVAGEPVIKATKTFEGNVYDVLIMTCKNLRHPCINTSLEFSKEVKKEWDGKGASKEKRISPVEELFKYWLEAYELRYGTPYRVTNYAKEKGNIRTLLVRYEGKVDTLKACVDVVMRLYDAKWKRGNFIRPTVGAFLAWLAREAEPYVLAENREEDTPLTTQDDIGTDLSRFDSKFGLE